MKKLLCMVLAGIFILASASCANAQTSTDNQVTDAEDEVIEITDPTVWRVLNETYIEPFGYCQPIEWQTVDELYGDNLVIFYLTKTHAEPESVTEDGLPNYPQEEVEGVIQQYFDVPTEQIRTARMYDEKLGTYHTWGIGSTWSTKVVGARKKGDKLYIDYEYFSELRSGIENVTIAYGTATLEKTTANEDGYKFVANKCRRLPTPTSTVIGESHPT